MGAALGQPAPAQAASGLTLDKVVSAHSASSTTSVTSPALTTSQAGELLVAFVSSDGPSSATQTVTSVAGAGLTWRLRQRTNAQLGTAEIWQAVATGAVTNATVKATHTGSYQSAITVAAFLGADLSFDGATKGASAASGAPTATVTTTRSGSWVWGVGNDWDRAVSRAVGSNQTKVDEFLASSGDTIWVQRQTAVTTGSGVGVPISDTGPTTDRWNLSVIEIPAASTDTTPPMISAVSSGTPTQTAATVSWTTDEPATTQVAYGTTTTYGSATTLDTALTTTHAQTLTGLTAGTTYHFQVKSADASNNLAVSPDATFTTAASSDTTPPTVSLSTPANNATVSGSVALSASASDNVGVAGVQFTVDGTNVGAEVSTAPYSTSWDSTTVPDGSHTISAKARDAAGNTATATATVSVSNTTADPASVGSWGPVQPWPEVSIHAALTYTGKVLTFQGDFTSNGQQYVLDPATGATTQVPNAAADLFCAGQAVLADGRILVVGGTSTSGGLGTTHVTAFNPATGAWQTLAPMHHPRWYPTATTLADGRVLVTSGANTGSSDLVQVPEVYDPQSNTWTDLTTATRNIPYYPFMYQLPDGRILQAGASEQATSTIALTMSTQQWSTVDGRVLDGASITNYAPGKLLKVGTASDSGFTGTSAATAYTLDMNQPTPSWQPTTSMAYPRSFVNLTNLPDGTVLATGGDTDKSGYNEANAVLPAEVWNPATGSWRTVAAMSVPRLYHSVALLLPDGRVFVSGSGGDAGVPDERNYQIYSPPYLFKGARPVITQVPSTVQYGTSAFVQTPDAASITSVSLIRTGSVTHSFDQNTRALTLPFTQASGGLTVQLPADGNVAPPGYYMLSIVNGNGVPSVSSMVRFPAPSEDTVPPTAPTNLAAAGGVGRADLTWTPGTDNVGIAHYDIFRSTSSGFTPGPSNQVGQTVGSATSYHDTGLAAGAYYYQVKAEDAATNLSPASNEASATVTSDTTPPTAPAGLTATAAAGQVGLSWTAATDNVGVTGYTVIRDGAAVGTTNTTSYTDTSVAPGSTYTYTVTAHDAAGNVGPASAPVAATVPSGARPVTIDKLVTAHQGAARATVSAGGMTTTGSGELLLAFLSSDGPLGAGTAGFSGVAGGGLTWTLRQRANAQAGTAEIWQAVAPAPLTNVTITATQASGAWAASMTVVGFLGADTAPGAVTAGSAASGAPTATLTTTRAGSWVWGVGTDWDAPVARTIGPNQSLVDQYLSPSADTYWIQRQTGPTPQAGTAVTINDTAPTADRYNLALIEVLPAP
ncbi:galactose oxidase-like domain-containing protein [Pedococcus sp.]|uniref:galactose oxidase-like domain-containing protein n=1 Tax=Pedococcus sp. TaxID=2860345 RepID=UPI002E0EF2AA|nr:galactose oxidase-like domain-containing protein [Pedococcus sp.]